MISYTLRALHIRSVRSWLTIIGIIVGITAIVVLIGLVQGLKFDVEEQLESFGPRSIVIIPVDVSQAAAFGGTTTVIDFVPQDAPTLAESINIWHNTRYSLL